MNTRNVELEKNFGVTSVNSTYQDGSTFYSSHRKSSWLGLHCGIHNNNCLQTSCFMDEGILISQCLFNFTNTVANPPYQDCKSYPYHINNYDLKTQLYIRKSGVCRDVHYFSKFGSKAQIVDTRQSRHIEIVLTCTAIYVSGKTKKTIIDYQKINTSFGAVKYCLILYRYVNIRQANSAEDKIYSVDKYKKASF